MNETIPGPEVAFAPTTDADLGEIALLGVTIGDQLETTTPTNEFNSQV